MVRPFKAMERPLLRDIIFYIAAVFFTFVVLYDKKITLPESLGTSQYTFCAFVGGKSVGANFFGEISVVLLNCSGKHWQSQF